MKKVKFAIIGLGHISKFYLKSIKKQPQAELVAVCDLDSDKLIKYKSSKIPSFNSLNKLLASGGFDAVMVTTPNNSHFSIISKCLKAHKHVLCEKPLALTLRQTKILTADAAKRNLLLMTAYHRRYNRNILKLVGRKNNIKIVYARYLEDIVVHSGNESRYFNSKKSGGGCVIDNGINVFDLLRHIFGDLNLEGSVVQYKKYDKYLYDSEALILAKYSKGYIFVELNWHNKKEIKDLVLVGDNGSIKKINLLAGSKKFKDSLWHEYDGVLKDFLLRLKQTSYLPDEASIKAMSLVEAVYKK